MNVTAPQVRTTATVVKKLEDQGIRVLNLHHNGRQAVLLLDRKPASVRGVLFRRQPAPGGVDRIMATPFHGVQIEWAEFVPSTQEVGHG